ncbi:uncharacterized protein LOC110463295 [Mizuhopecten yessoensis]|uniref:Uncharacterized protein n=1 Tax=Mizuhopecten yessoensis TaxID=6573 RepID=A0A210PWF5_MIZYE|nr:uncharacterized protein LOC110463295 [Mizuhopecten yessoensis]OWF40837.1 hypothetical protein KP79_PYT09240 [Mizuhopecten yessoensis]
MARNEEKQLGRLNRLLLKQNKEEQEKKNPRRPRLDDLHSSEAIKKWIPSIKRDIDFFLKQSQVPCYPDSKIQECNSKIDFLRRQYWAFVRKLRQLDPSTRDTPWTERHYAAKKRQHSPTHQDTDEEIQKKQQCIDNSNSGVISPVYTSSTTNPISRGSVTSLDKVVSPDETVPDVVDRYPDFRPICTPILDGDRLYQTLYGYQPTPCFIADGTVSLDLQDQPLIFCTKDNSVESNSINGMSVSVNDVFNSQLPCDDQTSTHLNDHNGQDLSQDSGDSSIIPRTRNRDPTGNSQSDNTMTNCGFIPYSDSSDDND